MKKTIIAAIAAATMLNANAGNDTLVIMKADTVRVIKNTNNVRIDIAGREGNSDYRYSTDFMVDSCQTVVTKEASSKRNFDFTLPVLGSGKNSGKTDVTLTVGFGLLLGNIYANADDKLLDIDGSASHEVWWANMLGVWVRPATGNFSFALDFGIDWRNYRMKNDMLFSVADDGAVSLAEYPEGVKPKYSRIKTLSQTITLTANWRIAKKLNVRFGPVLSINNGLSALSRYTTADGEMIKAKTNDPKVKQLTVDYFMGVTWHNFGLYVKHSPQSIFSKGWGPQFSSTTLGFNFFW